MLILSGFVKNYLPSVLIKNSKKCITHHSSFFTKNFLALVMKLVLCHFSLNAKYLKLYLIQHDPSKSHFGTNFHKFFIAAIKLLSFNSNFYFQSFKKFVFVLFSFSCSLSFPFSSNLGEKKYQKCSQNC